MSSAGDPRLFRFGLLGMAVTVLSWGAFFPVGKMVVARLDPYVLSSIRYGCAAVILLAILFAVEGRAALAGLRGDRRAWQMFVFGSLGFAGFSLFTFEGLRLTNPQQAAIIVGSQPMMMVLYQWLARGLRPTRLTRACVALAFAGCALVASRGSLDGLVAGGNALGNALVLCGALCWMAYTLGGTCFPDWSPLRFTALSCAAGTLSIFIFTLAAVVLGRAYLPDPSTVVDLALPMAFLVIMASVVAVLLWNFGVKTMGPLNASLFGNFVPVVVFAIGLAQGQQFAAAELAGGALVLAALVANNARRGCLRHVDSGNRWA